MLLAIDVECIIVRNALPKKRLPKSKQATLIIYYVINNGALIRSYTHYSLKLGPLVAESSFW